MLGIFTLEADLYFGQMGDPTDIFLQQGWQGISRYLNAYVPLILLQGPLPHW